MVNKKKSASASSAKASADKKASAHAKSSVGKEGKLIGKISHYFSDIGVAVIDLSATLKEGDNIRIIGGEDTDFNQEAVSMQIEHEKVKSAKKGDSVGLKVKKKVREGYSVYKI